MSKHHSFLSLPRNMESYWVIGSLAIDQFKFIASLTKFLCGTATRKQSFTKRKVGRFPNFPFFYFLLPFKQYVQYRWHLFFLTFSQFPPDHSGLLDSLHHSFIYCLSRPTTCSSVMVSTNWLFLRRAIRVIKLDPGER